jgi:plastocyanin
MKRYALAAGAAALLILLAACGSSSGLAKTTSPTSGGILISNSTYSGSMTVKPGQKVTVTNMDPTPHTLTNKRTALFSTGTIKGGGGTGTFTAPLTPGSYEFWCILHPAKEHGTLIVQG